MQGCQNDNSLKRALVMDLYTVQRAVPARNQKKHNQKQKKQSKQKTQPQPKQNKQNTEKWDRNQQWEFMHDDILCVIMRMAPNKKQNKQTTEKHQGPGQRV